ncbi:uncharacterized protein ARMOST_14754 [Armillaria ostoyae]|uniref:Telomeric single stranded DNA binding POT1/Cdc13 domain-containing protein n=1 Tax=Armillaria ostoyae TaxID=47428 RepID=A0A284RRF4_ARMOS|nr:uncharacterized protein ARMOST_14754 [Armillaria ostoyae]
MQHSPVERTTPRLLPAVLIPFDNPSLKRLATDLLSNPDDDSGYVICIRDRTENCQMIFKIDASSDGKSSVPFDVIFAGECFDAVSAQGLKLCSMDKLDLALEGAVIYGNLLEYKAGIRLKVVKSWKVAKNNGRVIDTWLLRRPALASMDENRYWRSIPADSQASLSTPQTPKLIRYDTPTSLPQGKRSHASTILADPLFLAKRLKQETTATEKLEPPKLTKKQRKALRAQRQRDRISALNDTTSLSLDIASTSKPKFTAGPLSAASAASVTGGYSSVTSTRPTLTPNGADSRGNISFLKLKRTPEQTALGMSSPDSISLLEGLLPMTAGLKRDYKYVALEETAMMDQGTLINVIGIVKSVSEPSLASHGQQLTCSIKILDPSVFSLEDSTWNDSDAFSVNCFTTKYKHWLPRPEVNDIVILRDVKIGTKFNDRSCAVGYYDKLQWAVYKKETGEIDHNRGDAPLFEGLGPNGLGVRFSPFHNAQPQEIDYCSKLSTWWRAILEKRQAELGTIHQIGEETPEHSMVPSTRRVHKLIRDVDHKFLDGYFDYHTNSMLPTTRKNDQAIPMRSKLWPSSLAETVLKIKMWDDALPIGRTMEQGRIYRMKNVRMIIGRSGGLEAKICERKISEPLDDSGHTDFDVHLQGFFERKELWKSDGKVA